MSKFYQTDNSLTLKGRLGDDPIVDETQRGYLYTFFSLAVNPRKQYRDDYDGKDAAGVVVDTLWVKCEGWGQIAETAEQLRKGDEVTVIGHLIGTDVYETRRGEVAAQPRMEVLHIGFGRLQDEDDRREERRPARRGREASPRVPVTNNRRTERRDEKRNDRRGGVRPSRKARERLNESVRRSTRQDEGWDEHEEDVASVRFSSDERKSRRNARPSRDEDDEEEYTTPFSRRARR